MYWKIRTLVSITNKKKVAIVHFLPLELYPPVMNFINFLTDVKQESDLTVYTTHLRAKQQDVFKSRSASIKIIRKGTIRSNAGIVTRALNYMIFYGTTLTKLVTTRPEAILYYDTISSFPALIYKKFFKRSCKICIHYHEYMTKQEYASGMKLLRFFHKIEKKVYAEASWISHTNKHRMAFFEADMSGISLTNKHILPNYPPQKWMSANSASMHKPIKFVQVGTIDLETMYIKEFALWVQAQHGKVLWDIYAMRMDQSIISYLDGLACPYIQYKGSVNYDNLPSYLNQYDVGLILYKGHIPNYIYNAPNKLFEYHVCGLDVWFPEQMITAKDYIIEKSFPKILPVNFNEISKIQLEYMINREGMASAQFQFTAEDALTELKIQLINSNN